MAPIPSRLLPGLERVHRDSQKVEERYGCSYLHSLLEIKGSGPSGLRSQQGAGNFVIVKLGEQTGTTSQCVRGSLLTRTVVCCHSVRETAAIWLRCYSESGNELSAPLCVRRGTFELS